MEFEKRLEKAVERGRQASAKSAAAEAKQILNEEEIKRLHSQYRLDLSDYIENCLQKLLQHFPGYRFQSVVSERGWGAAVSRDDLEMKRRGERDNKYSRLEIVIRPLSEYHVLELSAKGTISNKEVFDRTHYERLSEADVKSFQEMIDLWVLEYAELFARKS